MAELLRFRIGEVLYKARIFERGSLKQECSCCGERRFGLLLRFIVPIKREKLICHECVVKLAMGLVKVEAPTEDTEHVKVLSKKLSENSIGDTETEVDDAQD